MTKDELLKMALDALEDLIEAGAADWSEQRPCVRIGREVATSLRDALAQPAQEPVLQDIEQYRMQIAGICTAAIGYWKEGDSIHPDYDTLALRDVAKLYAKYDALYKARWAAQPEQYSDLISDGGLDPRNKFDAQPEQEPAFYGFMLEEECCVNICYSPCGPGGPNNELPTAYYTSPPQRQPLTLAEIDALDFKAINGGSDSQYSVRFTRAIEAAHGIGDKT